MREDFNKLLTERERNGSHAKYGDVRHSKKGVDDEIGGREGMKRKHIISSKGYTKSFSENLNPLIGYLRTRLGKPWDKTYSEIRQNFDARKVINDHILQHLFDFVEIHAKIIDGKPMVLQKYRHEWIPIRESYSDFYVDPRDGLLKETLRAETGRQKRARMEAKQAQELHAVKRVIDANTELHLLNGLWYVITIKDKPKPVVVYSMPHTPEWGDVGAKLRWEKLDLYEKARLGTGFREYPAVVEVALHDELYSGIWNRFHLVWGRYHASKRPANSKLIREHGLAVPKPTGSSSHIANALVVGRPVKAARKARQAIKSNLHSASLGSQYYLQSE